MNNQMYLRLHYQPSLILTTKMQQALQVLQLPIMELAQWLQLEIEQNPALQFDDVSQEQWCEVDPEHQGFEVLEYLDETFIETVFPEEWVPEEKEVAAPISIYQHLMDQARVAFSDPSFLTQAEEIIGGLDEQGFIGRSYPDSTVLQVVQTFDPPGIAARDLQDSLLIQLRRCGKEKSISYQILECHFESVKQGRLSWVAKQVGLHPHDLIAIMRTTLFALDFCPKKKFETIPLSPVIPDIILEREEHSWHITINEQPLPPFFLDAISCGVPTFHRQARWIATILHRRKDILTKITLYLLDKQADFFLKGLVEIQPLTLHEMGNALGLHESTIGRAVKDKYLLCPRGTFPLRYFFPHAAVKDTSTSHIGAKRLLEQLIHQEDPAAPSSDHHLAQAMAAAGVPCARRTVAKYRKLLQIPSVRVRGAIGVAKSRTRHRQKELKSIHSQG